MVASLQMQIILRYQMIRSSHICPQSWLPARCARHRVSVWCLPWVGVGQGCFYYPRTTHWGEKLCCVWKRRVSIYCIRTRHPYCVSFNGVHSFYSKRPLQLVWIHTFLLFPLDFKGGKSYNNIRLHVNINRTVKRIQPLSRTLKDTMVVLDARICLLAVVPCCVPQHRCTTHLLFTRSRWRKREKKERKKGIHNNCTKHANASLPTISTQVALRFMHTSSHRTTCTHACCGTHC